MYLKLAFRNAKRSVSDYLLYIFSMAVLVAVMCISNCLANWGEMQAGFQTASLPLLIVIIMVLLTDYLNTFIVKQRAKEFATYMLLGMERDKLALTFLGELSMIGVLCFILGAVSGTGIFLMSVRIFLQGAGGRALSGITGKSALQTFLYFCSGEVLSILFMRGKLYRLQIVRLMQEKRRNQPLGKGKPGSLFWGIVFLAGFLLYLLLLCAVSFLPEKIMAAAISVISIPVLLCVCSFYKWMYVLLVSLRLSKAEGLYRGSRLYRIAALTAESGTGAKMNAVFCICLIFSAASFVSGRIFIHPEVHIFERAKQQWMGFLQMGICVIFMVIYFSTLSLLQIVDLRREAGNRRLLFYMGRNRSQCRALLCTQILVKLLLPTLMAFILSGTVLPFVNVRVNSVLPAGASDLLLRAGCEFMLFFAGMYLCYFCVIYLVFHPARN